MTTGVEIDDEIDDSLNRSRLSAERMLRLADGDLQDAISISLGAIGVLASGTPNFLRTLGECVEHMRTMMLEHQASLIRRQARSS